jgi:hypothetical protein
MCEQFGVLKADVQIKLGGPFYGEITFRLSLGLWPDSIFPHT